MGVLSTDAQVSKPKSRFEESDLHLTRAALSGDETAKRKLVEKVYAEVRRTLVFISNRNDEVDDLTQSALIEVLLSLESYRGEAPLIHWADRIAVRTAAKHFDKRRRRDHLFAKVKEDFTPQVGASADETSEYREKIGRVQLLVAGLSDDNRLALILHHVKGYPIDEIAALLGCSKFTIKGRLRRSRRRLKREILKDEVLSEWIAHEFGRRQT